jgi:cardiolipin synthase
VSAEPAGWRREVALARTAAAPLRIGNDVTLLQNGEAAYQEWLAEIARAERTIHVENYIFRSDATGHRFAEALRERAAAGVAVRVVYDAFGSRHTDQALWADLRRAGVEVRRFNPLQPLWPFDYVRRDHRKVLTVDGRYASVGGIGIGDAWIERDPVSGLFYRDTAVGVRGPIVADVERAFAAIWRMAGPPLPDDALVSPEAIPATGDYPAWLVAQEPGRMRISWLLQVMTAGVESRLWIADAYFLADAMLRQALKAAAQDGVDVRLLLPSATDAPAVGVLSRYGYRRLLEAGIRIWEYRGPMMHAKTSVADGWWSRVGSTNLNVTGLLTNWEIDLLIEHPSFAAEMEAMFEDDLAHADEVRLDDRRVIGGATAVGGHLPRGATPGAGSRLVGVGSAALRLASGAALEDGERRVEVAAGGLALVVAAMALHLPRAVAWLLGALSGTLGLATLAYAFRARRRQPARAGRSRD